MLLLLYYVEHCFPEIIEVLIKYSNSTPIYIYGHVLWIRYETLSTQIFPSMEIDFKIVIVKLTREFCTVPVLLVRTSCKNTPVVVDCSCHVFNAAATLFISCFQQCSKPFGTSCMRRITLTCRYPLVIFWL